MQKNLQAQMAFHRDVWKLVGAKVMATLEKFRQGTNSMEN